MNKPTATPRGIPCLVKATLPFQSGFSLIELAIVLVVVALLLGGLLVPLTMQIEQQKVRETQKTMDEIKEALIGFAIVNRYLPCPALSATDGSEGPRVGSKCSPRVGYVPWGVLGTSKLDGWGRILRYSVTPAYSDNATYFSLAPTPRDITIQTRDASGTLVNLSAASDIPAVIVSHGKNGYLGTTDAGTLVPNSSVNNPDEVANGSATGTSFVTRTASDNAAIASGEFDDLVTWLSPNILFNRMVAAGRLP